MRLKTLSGLFLICLLYSCKQVKQEIYYFPEGFSGWAVIIYGEETGVQDSIVNKSVIYKIPAAGVLVLKDYPHGVNVLYDKCFYYGSSGRITPICNYYNAESEGLCIGEFKNIMSGAIGDLKFFRVLIEHPDHAPSDFELFMDTSKVVKQLMYLKEKNEGQ